MRTLLIDDAKTMKVNATARTYDEGIRLLTEEGPWDTVYLDHDLGGEETGYDILCYLEENPEFIPGNIVLVTLNPEGRRRMQLVLDRIARDHMVEDDYEEDKQIQKRGFSDE